MNTCDTCKYWELPPEIISDPTLIVKCCLCPKMQDGCEGNDFCTYDDGNDGGDTFGIMTGPKFGCIHHTPKNKP